MGEEEEEDDDEDNEDDEQEEEEGMIFKNYLYRLFLSKILKIYNSLNANMKYKYLNIGIIPTKYIIFLFILFIVHML